MALLRIAITNEDRDNYLFLAVVITFAIGLSRIQGSSCYQVFSFLSLDIVKKSFDICSI